MHLSNDGGNVTERGTRDLKLPERPQCSFLLEITVNSRTIRSSSQGLNGPKCDTVVKIHVTLRLTEEKPVKGFSGFSFSDMQRNTLMNAVETQWNTEPTSHTDATLCAFSKCVLRDG